MSDYKIIKLMSANNDDYIGHANLEIISENYRFNDWMYRQIKTRLKEKLGNILEVGSGLGTFSEKIIRDMEPSSRITLTDVSASYVQALRKRYSSCQNVYVNIMDLNSREEYSKIGYEKYDSIIALNVLEHIKDDQLALLELYKMLKKGGILVILVPCHKFLFNVIDVNIGHFRRYTKKELRDKVNQTNFNVEHMRYFNTLGMVGWYFNGNVFKNAGINPTASKWFDRLVPFLDYLDRMTFNKIGLSLICYLKK
jgi:2-polyprenyl-3-methyl-5-hydroxy-6-metoxy-1,4-benzoquinol methylase